MARIRRATRRDVREILRMIRELADYEQLSRQVVATESLLVRHLFGRNRAAEVLVAEERGQAVGFALFFPNFSTFLARPGIYLEDLYVEPTMRGRGIGTALLKGVARVAVQRGAGRFEWAVLDWNKPAIRFYKSLGARPLHDWTVFRVTGRALTELGGRGGRAGRTRRKKGSVRRRRR